jgi:hypothetical protein
VRTPPTSEPKTRDGIGKSQLRFDFSVRQVIGRRVWAAALADLSCGPARVVDRRRRGIAVLEVLRRARRVDCGCYAR